MKTSRVLPALVIAVVVLAGCGLATGGGAAPSLPPPTEPPPGQGGSAVVLRVEQLGGMVGWETQFLGLPQASVYADGRVLREVEEGTVPVEELPALPQILQRTLTPAGLEDLVEQARSAGVGDGADLGEPLVTDVRTTRFLLATEKGPVWSDAYALTFSAGLDVAVGQDVPSPSISVGSGRDDGTFTQDQADARYELLDLAAALDDLSAALGADQVGAEVAYRPGALAVVATPVDADPSLAAVPWPGPALPGQDVKVGGASCTVVAGADLAPVLEAAAQARLRTPWTDRGRTWSLSFRPLLPDESGCQDLASAPSGS